MKFFALEERRVKHSADADPEWTARNLRLGGYRTFNAALKAIMSHARHGRIINEQREVVGLVQEGKLTFKRA